MDSIFASLSSRACARPQAFPGPRFQGDRVTAGRNHCVGRAKDEKKRVLGTWPYTGDRIKRKYPQTIGEIGAALPNPLENARER